MAKWDVLEGSKAEEKDDKRTNLASKIVDALRGDAMKIAMDSGAPS